MKEIVKTLYVVSRLGSAWEAHLGGRLHGGHAVLPVSGSSSLPDSPTGVEQWCR